MEVALWLSLFKAETEEDLDKIKEMGVPAMEQAVNAYYSITASSEFREIERLREKARHDEAQALYHAKQEGRQEGRQEGMVDFARTMLADGGPVSKIMRYTGLARSEVENLRTAL